MAIHFFGHVTLALWSMGEGRRSQGDFFLRWNKDWVANMSCSVYHLTLKIRVVPLISAWTSQRTPWVSAGSHICVWNIAPSAISSRAYWRGRFCFWVWNRKILTRSNSSGVLLSLSQLCCLNVALCSLILVVCTKSFTCNFLSVVRTSTSNWRIHLTNAEVVTCDRFKSCIVWLRRSVHQMFLIQKYCHVIKQNSVWNYFVGW